MYVTWKCPNPTCTNPFITFQDKSGFQNPFTHLRSCYGRGEILPTQIEVLQNLYYEAFKVVQNVGSTIRGHVYSNALSEYEKNVNGYLRLIFLRSAPLLIVEDTDYRSFSCFKTVTISEKVKQTVLKFGALVEKRIENELQGTFGAVMFDGWSKFGTHYISMIASYMKTVADSASMKGISHFQQRFSLIDLPPIS